MQNFGHCIWLVPEENVWDLPEKGFQTHITIYKNLSSFDALRLFLSLSNKSIIIDRGTECIKTHENGFHALQYPVNYSKSNKEKQPAWWTKNQHVSVRYKYDSQIKDTHVENMSIMCRFNKFIIMKCDGHFSEWSHIM